MANTVTWLWVLSEVRAFSVETIFGNGSSVAT